MKLLIDIGNTRVKWGFCEAHSDVLRKVGAVVRADFTNELVESWLRPESIWVSNVGSAAALQELSDQLDEVWGIGLTSLEINNVVVTENACDIDNAYDDLGRLGVDRWVAAIGARGIVPLGDVIIVDAGTAVTIDWLSAANRFEGGVILPGQRTMHDSLVGRTAGIESEYLDALQIIGKNTAECVNSGVGYGLVGAVERIVLEMQKFIKVPTDVIFTGGGASAILSKSSLDARLEPELVLLGLMQIANKQNDS